MCARAVKKVGYLGEANEKKSCESESRYNVYRAELIIRHAADHKLYLYDVINIKKETSTPLEQ